MNAIWLPPHLPRSRSFDIVRTTLADATHATIMRNAIASKSIYIANRYNNKWFYMNKHKLNAVSTYYIYEYVWMECIRKPRTIRDIHIVGLEDHFNHYIVGQAVRRIGDTGRSGGMQW